MKGVLTLATPSPAKHHFVLGLGIEPRHSSEASSLPQGNHTWAERVPCLTNGVFCFWNLKTISRIRFIPPEQVPRSMLSTNPERACCVLGSFKRHSYRSLFSPLAARRPTWLFGRCRFRVPWIGFHFHDVHPSRTRSRIPSQALSAARTRTDQNRMMFHSKIKMGLNWGFKRSQNTPRDVHSCAKRI